MVYVPPEELGWMPFVKTWVRQLGRELSNEDVKVELTPETIEFVERLFDRYLPEGLEYVRKNCKEAIPTVDINLVTSTANIFTGMCVPERGVDFTKPAEDLFPMLAKIFAFAFVFGLGGSMNAVHWDAFDEWVRNKFETQQDECMVKFPPQGLVFDNYMDIQSEILQPWENILPEFKYSAAVPYFELVVPTIDTTRYSFILETLLNVNRSSHFTGGSGVGKSASVVSKLNELGSKKWMQIPINFSAQTPAIDTQYIIESKLEKKRKTRFGAPMGNRIVVFVDDVNMPAKETYGAQPPVELLRQFQDMKGFYDRKKLFWKDIEDTTLCCACAPTGGGRQELTPRFVRHFNILNFPQPGDEVMRTIFSSILGGFLEAFPSEFKGVTKSSVDSTIEVYERVSEELLPTPSKSHYTFNLRDVSKVFQGCLMISPAQCQSKPVFRDLWIHEVMRVFHDRLIDDTDKGYFTQLVYEMLRMRWDVSDSHDDLFVERKNFFGDYMRMGATGDDRVYEQVLDTDKMHNILLAYLEDYNASATNQMNLVFFADAMEHLVRLCRILRQPRGNAMLVGVGGSGKQSMTRFACFMAEYKCFSIELTRSYGMTEFREDLKNPYKMAGIDGDNCCFLFTDSQIMSETQLEDINNMLNSGEVPGMYGNDDKEKIIADIRPYAQERGIPETREALYQAFVNRVRNNLHIVLCMCPVGEAFRSRCRQNPSLIGCTTIDWYTDWPEAALHSVAERFLEKVKLENDEVHASVVEMCVTIHTSIAAMSERMFTELRRRYYITPKSYLYLINLYVQLLAEKREEYTEARDRLLNGLMKLNETNEVVDTLRDEITRMQPILAEKAEATAVLLVQVNKDKEEAEKVKAVVAVEEAEVKKSTAETQAIKDDAEADLAEALPALEAAQKALNALNKNDIVEIKGFVKPPSLVQLTMEAVCTLLGEKTDWDSAKKVLTDGNFLKRLFDYDKDAIEPKVLKQLKKYVDDPVYTPDQVAKQSVAAKSLCMWSRAMDLYAKVAKVVGPKQQALREAEESRQGMQAALAEKQAQLKAVVDNVAALEKQLQDAMDEQQQLKDDMELSEKRLVRAGKLTSALGDEAVRWDETSKKIGEDMVLLIGDVFLGAACVSYYGAFTGTYRNEIVDHWVEEAKERKIPVSESFSLQSTLSFSNHNA